MNPLTVGPDYMRFFIFLLAHYVPPFKLVKDTTLSNPNNFHSLEVVDDVS